MKEYDIYLPLTFNNGAPVPAQTIGNLKKQLVAYFGGLTDFRYPNQGTSRMGNILYHDEILILRVLAEEGTRARVFLSALKDRLRVELEQHDILILEREVRAI